MSMTDRLQDKGQDKMLSFSLYVCLTHLSFRLQEDTRETDNQEKQRILLPKQRDTSSSHSFLLIFILPFPLTLLTNKETKKESARDENRQQKREEKDAASRETESQRERERNLTKNKTMGMRDRKIAIVILTLPLVSFSSFSEIYTHKTTGTIYYKRDT